MKIRTTFMIEENLLKTLKKTAIDGNKKYSEMLEEILKDKFYKPNTNTKQLEDMF